MLLFTRRAAGRACQRWRRQAKGARREWRHSRMRAQLVDNVTAVTPRRAARSADSDTGIHHRQWQPPFVFVTYLYSLKLFSDFQILVIIAYSPTESTALKKRLILREVRIIRITQKLTREITLTLTVMGIEVKVFYDVSWFK